MADNILNNIFDRDSVLLLFALEIENYVLKVEVKYLL